MLKLAIRMCVFVCEINMCMCMCARDQSTEDYENECVLVGDTFPTCGYI